MCTNGNEQKRKVNDAGDQYNAGLEALMTRMAVDVPTWHYGRYFEPTNFFVMRSSAVYDVWGACLAL